jgi:hypothetical protein
MANSAAGGASDYNTEIINEFRGNGGHVGGVWAGTTLILIHHIGARSGVERVTPVGCFPQGDGRFTIWAANGDRRPTRPGTTTSRPTPRSPSRWVPRRSRPWRRSWTAPPASGCGRSWSGHTPTRRSPGQDHAAVSGVRADAPGVTRGQTSACTVTVLRESRPANVQPGAMCTRLVRAASPAHAPGSGPARRACQARNPAAERSPGRHRPRTPQLPRPGHRHPARPRQQA